MQEALDEQKTRGVEAVAFGDIFLEDLRKYREEKLAQVGLPALFPIWKEKTTDLAEELISSGFVTTITCADSEAFAGTGVSAEDIVGRQLNRSLLADLPDVIDPCGENGEFHSFVHEAPIFREPIPITVGEKVLRDERFWFCDLVPA
jgi:diphthamide synthase (EF-2-diphthine--ammonia ligase)